MRLGLAALRGSNPRSSAVTSSVARAAGLGGLLVAAFAGPLRGHRRTPAARLPPRYPPPRGPGQARDPGRLAPITSRPAVMSARHGGPGTYPAPDRAATVDTDPTRAASRSQQTPPRGPPAGYLSRSAGPAAADARAPGRAPPRRRPDRHRQAHRPPGRRPGRRRDTMARAPTRTRNPGSRSVSGIRPGAAAWAAAVSPDGTRLAPGGAGRSPRARAGDTASGRQLPEVRHAGRWVTAAAVSPDGTRPATGSLDRSARI